MNNLLPSYSFKQFNLIDVEMKKKDPVSDAMALELIEANGYVVQEEDRVMSLTTAPLHPHLTFLYARACMRVYLCVAVDSTN